MFTCDFLRRSLCLPGCRRYFHNNIAAAAVSASAKNDAREKIFFFNIKSIENCNEIYSEFLLSLFFLWDFLLSLFACAVRHVVRCNIFVIGIHYISIYLNVQRARVWRTYNKFWISEIDAYDSLQLNWLGLWHWSKILRHSILLCVCFFFIYNEEKKVKMRWK